ncbi:hypothetical protein CFOL_v3_14898 [Cephalotus follicularis]|uniref:Uncharacterized protein n=1 Tax=Cephalotus follicularis TaxID=3775 RepID=A0A1Q3BTX9_CEPFO|nr:hypothetical protein CFOL_v3_14898 [Cephalotus follicularis]
MASTCISTCINDARLPVRRPTYVNLYKWPGSDSEFVRSVSSSMRQGAHAQPRIVDSISCRQMYLKSYTFSRKESVPQKTKKCFGRVKDRVKNKRKKRKGKNRSVVKKRCLVQWRAKEVSCAALFSIFGRLLSCTTKVDVAD